MRAIRVLQAGRAPVSAGVAGLPIRKQRAEYARGVVMALWTREEVASDRLLGAFLAASVVVVLVGWVGALVYLFGFRLL